MAGARKSLIVANDLYDHDGLAHLLAPEADAEALAGVLGDPAIGDFQVRVVRNQPAHVIREEIEELFSDSRTDDVLLLHFSCHGLKGDSGELFFATRNTRPNRLGSTAVSADFVQRCMRTSRSRSIVLLLDCCYGGAFSTGVRVRAAGNVNVLDSFPGRLDGGRGRAVITASSAMEYAFEGDHLADERARRPSVFTAALVEGLATGDADRDRDGWVSLNELYDYVFDRVRERNPNQTPSRDVEMQGELYLARSPHRPTDTPAPARVQTPPPRRRRKKRWWSYAAAAALAAVGVAVILLRPDGSTPTAQDGPLPLESFTAEAPWRLLIDDNIQGNDVGCTVGVVHVDSGRAVAMPTSVYSPVAVQMRDSGRFRWSVNDPGCLVLHRSGPGSTRLPFTPQQLGDTDAFTTNGPVTAEIVDDGGNSSCKLVLHDAEDGRQLEVKDVPRDAGPVTLDPGGRTEVYLGSRYCLVKLSHG
jgi:hypothetical protein